MAGASDFGCFGRVAGYVGRRLRGVALLGVAVLAVSGGRGVSAQDGGAPTVVCAVTISVTGAQERDGVYNVQPGRDEPYTLQCTAEGDAMLVLTGTPPDGIDFMGGNPFEPFAAPGNFEFTVAPEFTGDSLTLTLADGHPAAGILSDSITLEAGCGGESGCTSNSCPPGSGMGLNGSLDYRVQLGETVNGFDAGELELYAERPGPELSTPVGLLANIGGGVTVNRDAAGVLTSVVAPQVSISVQVVDSFSYRLVVTDPLGAVIRTITVVNPDGAASDHRLHISEDAEFDRVWFYTWSDQDQEWTLSEGGSAAAINRVTRRSSEDTADGRVEMLTVLDGSQTQLLSRTRTVYEQMPWGEERVEETLDPSDVDAGYVGQDATTRWFYGQDLDAADYARLRMRVSANGDWTYYGYDDGGSVVQTVHGVGQTPPPDPDQPVNIGALAAANRGEQTLRMALDLGDGDGQPERVRRTVVSALGQPQRVTYTIDWSNTVVQGAELCEVQWQVRGSVADPEQGHGSTTAFLLALVADPEMLGNEVSKRYRLASFDAAGQPQNNALRLKRTESSDGRLAYYRYPAPGTTVVERGYPDPGGTLVVRGSRTTTVLSAMGQVDSVLIENRDPAVPGGWFTASATRTLARDNFDRPTSTGHYFGAEALAEWSGPGTGIAAYTTSQTYACCGVETQTDRYGLMTSHGYGALGHRSATTRPDGVTLHYTYDATGRVVKVEREGDGQIQTVDGQSQYGLAGRVQNRQDAGGKFTFYTYRKLKPDGSVFDPTSDTGPFFQETRTYPHNAASGPVRSVWTDSHGRTVLSLSGSVPTDWQGSPPAGVEAFSAVHSRVETDYDWDDRVSVSRRYHTFGGLNPAQLQRPVVPQGAAEGQHYDAESGGVYDALGRLVRSQDVAGNITVTVYDAAGRPVQTWAGTDDGDPTDPAAYRDPASLSGDLVQVAGTTYDAHGELEASLRLRPGLSALQSFAQDAVGTHASETYHVVGGAATGRSSWTQPADGISPWAEQVYDAQGRLMESNTYAHGSTTQLLAKQTNVYAPDTHVGDQVYAGRLTATRTHEVTNGVAGAYLETTYAYDDAGRRFKTGQPAGGFSVTLYDAVGRVDRTLVVADDNGTDAVSDDLVVSETVYGYDAADNVIWTETHARRHDASAATPGLLSGQPALAEVTYNATWYDDAHRPTHQVDYGDQAP